MTSHPVSGIDRTSLAPGSAMNPPTDVHDLLELALRGLRAMHIVGTNEFAQTVRGQPGEDGPHLRAEGTNDRYAAIVALGLATTEVTVQRSVLSGQTAADLVHSILARVTTDTEPGAVALAAWAAAEVCGIHAGDLFSHLAKLLADPAPLATVDVSWMLTAALAARKLDDNSAILTPARARLLAEQGPRGVFPHALPAASLGRWRAHVGCYADQVYPIQALARLAAATGDAEAMDAASRCAARIVELQGPAGQWWWHYDVRNGSVVEGFPVYSVHQHAMGPMALMDLHEAGGDDHRPAVALGLEWMRTHPEVFVELVDRRQSVVWRKVGRREPPKAARSLAAVTTTLLPGRRVPVLDAMLPPNQVDYECRPYELGWMLYAWGSGGVVERLRRTEDQDATRATS